jgi:hypothetical protein
MDIKSKKEFKLFLEATQSKKVAQDINSRIKRLETILSINVDHIPFKDFSLIEISNKLKKNLLNNKNIPAYIYVTKAGMICALRHYLKYRFPNQYPKFPKRINPDKY